MTVTIDEKVRTERRVRAEHAAHLADRYGFKMIPVHSVGPDGKTCSCPAGASCPPERRGKHPRGEKWQDRTDGLEEIQQTAQRGANFNIGVLVEPSSVVVVDIDPRNGGDATMRALVEEHGPMPKTRVVKTGSDGWHYYFRAPEGAELAGTLGAGIDLKSNGMVIAEMSRSGTGEYTALTQHDIADLPQWIVDEAGRDPGKVRAPASAPAEPLDENDPDLPRREKWCDAGVKGEFAILAKMSAAAKPGGVGYEGPPWNNTCFNVACNMWEFVNTPEARLDAATMVDQFLQIAPRDDNFGEKELLILIESARKKVGGAAREIPKPPVDPFAVAAEMADPDDAGDGDNDAPVQESGERHSGQLRMAYRLANEAKDELMHVRGLGWFYWTGTHWAEDEIGRSTQLVIRVLRKALAESVGDKELRQDVTKCESASAINGILSIASTMPSFARRTVDLDSDPFLLNAPNGTWDFRARALRPHDPEDRITKITGASIVPEPDAAAWDDFLGQVLPDESVREFLRRALGQGLLGLVLEHAFLILTGLGGNGKGVFYGVLTKALGSYGTVIDPALLLMTESGKTGGPELLQLMGARTVVGSETGESRKLDEATMKRLTGGDRLSARNLYKPPVTWEPSHQLVYVTNHLPTVKGNDPAIWRRVRVVPFDIVVPEEKRDPELGAKLEASMEAVLAWVIQGYYDYREIGMSEPASVLAATDEYQKSSDAVRRFVEEECLTSPAATATTRILHGAWQRWAIAEGTEVLSEKMLVRELRRLGYDSKRTNRGMTWKGLTPLVTQGEED